MLDMLKARKEALEERGNNGFTLAELLIVVAIIAVLVAISIPVFTTQLEKSRESVDFANVRSAYAEVMSAALTSDGEAMYNGAKMKQGDGSYIANVTLKQQQNGWQTDISNIEIGGLKSSAAGWGGTPTKDGNCQIKYTPAAADGTGENMTLTWS